VLASRSNLRSDQTCGQIKPAVRSNLRSVGPPTALQEQAARSRLPGLRRLLQTASLREAQEL
jgi:hypothetical protein